MTTFLLLTLSAVAAIFVLWPAVTGRRDAWHYSDEDTPLGRLATRREARGHGAPQAVRMYHLLPSDR